MPALSYQSHQHLLAACATTVHIAQIQVVEHVHTMAEWIRDSLLTLILEVHLTSAITALALHLVMVQTAIADLEQLLLGEILSIQRKPA